MLTACILVIKETFKNIVRFGPHDRKSKSEFEDLRIGDPRIVMIPFQEF